MWYIDCETEFFQGTRRGERTDMGVYLNPGNEPFTASVNSELYVDKTELIKYTNSRIGWVGLSVPGGQKQRETSKRIYKPVAGAV